MNKITILSQQPELIQQAKAAYNFQKELSAELDYYGDKDFASETLLKIVLWKLNRYPLLDNSILADINTLRHNCTEQNARTLLDTLLTVKGIDLPLASTFLRFACPDHFQIIDQRVYRFISPDQYTLKLPRKNINKIDCYFAYLTRLREWCEIYGIVFREADRVLYQMDKDLNRDHPIRY